MNPASDTLTRQRDLNSLYLLTVLVVLAIVTMTFGALVLAFVFRSQVALNWNRIALPPILWLTTAALLASSVTYALGRRQLIAGHQRTFFRYTAWTTALGVLFLIGQMIAWFQLLRAGVVLDRNPHSSFIFIFSGLHGAHIVAGLAGLIYLLARTRTPASGPKYQQTTRAVANAVSVFWHYLDFVWLVLYGLLLTWRR